MYTTIKSDLANNINNYSKESVITLTGTFVDEEGNETEITKESKVKVNWHGVTRTIFTNLSNEIYDITSSITDESFNAKFNVGVVETSEQLLMQKQEVEIIIPELNGYKPTSVISTTSNIEQTYDESAGILFIKREAEVDVNGDITKSVARSNIYYIEVQYPIEAYETLGQDSVVLNVSATAKNYGYNYEKYDNPYVSSANTTFSAIYTRVRGFIWDLDVSVGSCIMKDGNWAWRVSKAKPMELYNGNVYEEQKDIYTVKWTVRIGDAKSVENITLEENGETDKFLKSSGQYESMYDYIKTVGVYFENATTILGKDGWIKLYDGETGELIETFTADTWSNYSSLIPYKVEVKSIKITTSKPVGNSALYVYQLKQIDDKLLKENHTEQEFYNLIRIFTNLKGTVKAPDGITYEGGNSEASLTRIASALYEQPYSVAKLSVEPNEITNQETKSVNIGIRTTVSNRMESDWRNGSFLIELPEEIINANIKDIRISNENVEITSYLVYENEGKNYIRIDTKNDEGKTYYISLNVDLTANPFVETRVRNIKLYAYNEKCNNYSVRAQDVYDLDSDTSNTDYIGFSSNFINLIAPQGLITTEFVTNYNDDVDSYTIAPNVAEINKADETRKATINVSISNNYQNRICNIVILGKIPFEGNSYVFDSNAKLGSEFTAHMSGEIEVPSELSEYATVFYSENENATKDLSDANNNWKTADQITDWSKIKTYLIDLGDYVLAKDKNPIFTYEVEVPENVDYNLVSYAAHAVWFSLIVNDAEYQTQTQPNKVGIKVIKKYNLELTKNKKEQNSIFVPGATYKVTTTDGGVDVSKVATTDENGKLIINDLYIGKEYTLKEIATQKDYELNNDEIKFIATEEENEGNTELKVTIIQGTAKSATTESDSNLVKIGVEDDAKYKLIINKKDENGAPLNNVKFSIVGKGKSNVYTTEDGKVEIKDLYVGEEYKLEEVKADGYYVDETPRKFKVIRNEESKILEISTDDSELNGAIIQENITGQSTVEVTISNEKIPKYNLQVIKIEEPEDGKEIKKLSNTVFELEEEDLQEINKYTTDEDGEINISGLYGYVEGKYICGRYTLTEITAKEGYANYGEKIKFYVEYRNNEYLVNIENKNQLNSLYEAKFEGDTLKIVIKNKPSFKMTKIDSETQEPLANAKFVIYELDENGTEVDLAKGIDGNYIGEDFVVTTDETGTVYLPLKDGYYSITEIGYPEGYLEFGTTEVFRIGSVSNSESSGGSSGTSGALEISCIEDLVDLSNAVKNGNSYANKTIILTRDLDFKNPDHYRDWTSTNYEDLNGDNITNDLLTELTTGTGFPPIGPTYNASFEGIFDGNGHEIQNLYISNNKSNNIGLFGYAQNATIKNLGVTGNIYNDVTALDIGGIVGRAINCTISNCYNKVNIESHRASSHNSDYVGGIAGTMSGTMSNCYNEGKMVSTSDDSNTSYSGPISWSGSFMGGLIGSCEGITMTKCYNIGVIDSTDLYVGGLIGSISSSSTIDQCYNTSDIKSVHRLAKYAGGLIGSVDGSGSITKSYNLGNVTGINYVSQYMYSGGIIGYDVDKSFKVINCYNTGDIIAESEYSYGMAGGIVGYIVSNSEEVLDTCYNIGDVIGRTKNTRYSAKAGGIIGSTYGTASNMVKNCYYVDTIEIEGTKTVAGTEISEAEIISYEFYEDFNKDNIWIYSKGEAPRFAKTYSIADVEESVELTIENTIKKYHVYTAVKDDIGGTISGESGKAYEEINYSQSNKKDIVMTPDEGYEIFSITINDEPIPFSANEDGSYTIPIGYIQDVKEDKNVVVTYTPIDQTLTIKKVDEEDNSPMEGVEFEIVTNPDAPEVGELSKNGSTYTIPDLDNNITDSVVGELQKNESTTYGFVYNEETGEYVSNNKGVASTAESYVKIDLSDYANEDYLVVVNAKVSSRTNYDYGFVTINKNSADVAYSTTAGRFVYVSGYTGINSQEQEYKTTITGGSLYYLHMGYRKAATNAYGNDTFTITGIKIYKKSSDSYEFKVDENGAYVSNNAGRNGTVANSYIELDLTASKFDYKVTVNAEIDATSYDYGYVTVNNSKTAPSYNTSSGRMVYISGVKAAQDYTRTLTKGSKYYIHLGYYNANTIATNADQFKINSIKIEHAKQTYTATTNEYGIAKVIVPQNKYQIIEKSTKEGYTLNSMPVDMEVTANSETNNTITITNKKKSKVIVHHYLKMSDGTLTTYKVAEDDIYYGDIDEEYSTSPNLDVEKLILQRDENKKYIIPENAIGTYKDEDIHVIYYYEAKPVTLTIHHYYEGTEDKYADDETIEKDATVVLNEDGTYSVKTGEQYEYILKDNETYKGLTSDIRLSYIESTIKENTTIEDTLTYNEDSEITYFYNANKYKYTINYYYAGVKDENATENGESEYGRELKYYDKLKDGYIFDYVEGTPLIIGSNEEENVINVYYKKDSFEYTIRYYYAGVLDSNMTETGTAEFESQISEYPTEGKQKTGYVFNRVSNIPLTITSNPANNIINVYYVKGSYKYTVYYYYDEILDDTKTVTGSAYYGNTVRYTDKNITGYRFEKAEGNPLTIKENADENIIRVYYVKANYAYTVNYYYNGELDPNETETGTAVYQSQVTEYPTEGKSKGEYTFYRVENVPLTISNNTAENIINVYYKSIKNMKLLKIDSERENVLANAQFVIYEVNKNNVRIDYAKDDEGNYVGELNENGVYINTTNDNGEIVVSLRDGYYEIREVGWPEGYKTNTTYSYFGIGMQSLYYVEDLVDLSIAVNNGENYRGKTLNLMKDIDFNNTSSYKNAVSTEYGDLNGNGETEELLTELTTGAGFNPIGNYSSRPFAGTFNGNGHEIKNLYINSSNSNIGLFGYATGKIENLGVSGEIKSNISSERYFYSYIGGVVGYGNATISNCYNGANITVNNVGESFGYCKVGGISGYGGNIIDCYNTGNITETSTCSSSIYCHVGGISGEDATISRCYNKGTISSNPTSKNSSAECEVGGIIGNSNGGPIIDCYNAGFVKGSAKSSYGASYVGGISGYLGYRSRNSELL